MSIKREPNSHECVYFGRKMSNNCCDIETSDDTYVCIGPDRDDEIYWDEKNISAGPTLKERVVIHCINDDEESNGENGFCFDIDLEDVLRFAAKYCRGIYDRVSADVEAYKE